MNLKQKFYRMCGKSRLYLRRSAPAILCSVAAVGVVGTAVAAVRVTPKAMELLKDAADEKRADLSKTEMIVAVAHLYIPATAIGVGTIFCIFGANALNKKQQVRLMSAYALLKNYHKGYRDKLIELHGEEADIEIGNAMVREHCNYHEIDMDEPDRKVIFYDEISGESIVRYEREIIDAEYHFNRNFTLRGYAFLNELYDFLGMRQTEYGSIAGWSMSSGIMWVDFEHRLIDNDDGGIACYSIDMIFAPEIIEEWEC